MGRVLTDEQEVHIQKLVCEKRPEQMKMDLVSGTRVAVQVLIQREFGLCLSIRAVGDGLTRRGATPPKPITRVYEQPPEAVHKWLDEQYSEIKCRAMGNDAEIHWGHETCVMNTDISGRIYSPHGQTPETCAVGGREKFAMISTVINRDKRLYADLKTPNNNNRPLCGQDRNYWMQLRAT